MQQDAVTVDHRHPQTSRQRLLTLQPLYEGLALQPWTHRTVDTTVLCLPQSPRSGPVSTIILAETQSNLPMTCDYS